MKTPYNIVDINSISEQNSPENLTFKRLDNSVQLFNLKYNEETGILAVHECVSVDRNLNVYLSYHGLVYSFRIGFDMNITVP